MTITERIFDILNKSKLSQKEFSLYIGVNEKTVSAWKKNNSLPPADKLSNISDFLNISLDFLITGNERSSFSNFTENELEMIEVFKKLTPTQQGKIIERAKITSEDNENDAIRKENVS